ncbi:MAG: hypothetical protein FWD31_11495 [Planctomycetaceae bacterium]|nr:hypothetical protein [Planctomycetaceae bacterium]
MTENEIETPPVRRPSWRDNKTVLWLVRIGFLLQFYIPMFVCCYYVYVNYPGYGLFYIWYVRTLILLVVQCSVLTLILRFGKLRSAHIVLWCLIVMNVIHSAYWLYFVPYISFPLTMHRLALPTALYFFAILIEWIVFFRKKKAANNSSFAPHP